MYKLLHGEIGFPFMFVYLPIALLASVLIVPVRAYFASRIQNEQFTASLKRNISAFSAVSFVVMPVFFVVSIGITLALLKLFPSEMLKPLIMQYTIGIIASLFWTPPVECLPIGFIIGLAFAQSLIFVAAAAKIEAWMFSGEKLAQKYQIFSSLITLFVLTIAVSAFLIANR